MMIRFSVVAERNFNHVLNCPNSCKHSRRFRLAQIKTIILTASPKAASKTNVMSTSRFFTVEEKLKKKSNDFFSSCCYGRSGNSKLCPSNSYGSIFCLLWSMIFVHFVLFKTVKRVTETRGRTTLRWSIFRKCMWSRAPISLSFRAPSTQARPKSMLHVPRCCVACELCWRCFRLSWERNWSGYYDVRYKMRWHAKLKCKQPWGQMSNDYLRSVNVYDLRFVKSNCRRDCRAVSNCKRFTVVMGKTCDPAEFI